MDNPKMKQCAYLSEVGKRCRKKSALRLRLHLEEGLYNHPKWVEVNLCPEHFSHYGGDFRSKKEKEG